MPDTTAAGMYRVNVWETNKFMQPDLHSRVCVQCHCFADVSFFHCIYDSSTPLPSRDNNPWQTKHSLFSLVSYPPGPLSKQLSLWRLCGNERCTWDYWLAPSQLCCSNLLWTRPCEDNQLMFLLASSVWNVYVFSVLIHQPSTNNFPSGLLQ